VAQEVPRRVKADEAPQTGEENHALLGHGERTWAVRPTRSAYGSHLSIHTSGEQKKASQVVR